MACEVWCGGAKAHKLCCSCSGEAMDELGGRKRGREPVSQIPVSEPRQTTKRRPHYVHFSATPPQVSSCVAQAGPWGEERKEAGPAFRSSWSGRKVRTKDTE